MANTKQTSKEMASLASKVLRSPSSSKTAKKLAGCTLSQTRTGSKRSK